MNFALTIVTFAFVLLVIAVLAALAVQAELVSLLAAVLP